MHTAHCFIHYITSNQLNEPELLGPMVVLMDMFLAYPDDATKFFNHTVRSYYDNFPRDFLRAMARIMRHRMTTGRCAYSFLNFCHAIVECNGLSGQFCRAELALPETEAFIPSAILCCHRHVCSAPQGEAMFSMQSLVRNIL